VHSPKRERKTIAKIPERAGVETHAEHRFELWSFPKHGIQRVETQRLIQVRTKRGVLLLTDFQIDQYIYTQISIEKQ